MFALMLCLFPSTQSINDIYNDLKENLLKRDTQTQHTQLAAWLISFNHSTHMAHTICNVVCVNRQANPMHTHIIECILLRIQTHTRAHTHVIIIIAIRKYRKNSACICSFLLIPMENIMSNYIRRTEYAQQHSIRCDIFRM